MNFALRQYQKDIGAHIIDNPRCAVWAGMGLGKTVSALTALEGIALCEDVYPALVLAPLRVARSVWPQETQKWHHLRHVRTSPIVGSALQRLRGLQMPADLYTMNYENLPWLIDLVGEDWPFKTVIADESTRLKGFRLKQGTQRARSLARVAHTRITRFIELTGTPSPNGLQDLWGQAWFLDSGERLGRTYGSYMMRWFQKSFDGYGSKPLPHAQREIEERLKDICISLNAADYFKLEEPIVNMIYVDLPSDARKRYNEMEKEMFTNLEGHEVEAFNAAARTNKCLQLANGAAYVGGSNTEWVEVHNEKIAALESVIEEASGAPILVAYNFVSDLARLRAAFPYGRVLDNNPKTVEAWNNGEIRVLFAHPASAGHGLNLQDGGNIIVFFGHNWNLEEYQQILERIGPVRQMQAGHNRPVFVHHIVARDTIEESVMERIKTKREVQDLLLEAMRRRV